MKMKAMLPTLKERKRYLAFEVIAPRKIQDFKLVLQKIEQSSLEFLGKSGFEKAGLIGIDKWNNTLQRGLFRVNHKHVDDLRASLTLIKEINDQNVIVRSVGVSGILKKAEEKYLAR